MGIESYYDCRRGQRGVRPAGLRLRSWRRPGDANCGWDLLDPRGEGPFRSAAPRPPERPRGKGMQESDEGRALASAVQLQAQGRGAAPLPRALQPVPPESGIALVAAAAHIDLGAQTALDHGGAQGPQPDIGQGHAQHQA